MRKSLLAFIQRFRTILSSRRGNDRLPYYITVILALIIVVFGINIFVELTDTLQTDTLALYDDSITEYVIGYRNPLLTDYFVAVTKLGDVYGYLVVLAITIFVARMVLKKWKYVVQIFLVLVLAAVSNLILKRFIDRARPEIEHLVVAKTLSYPSGHAMAAIAFYGFIMYLFYKYVKNTYLKILYMLLLAILIISIGLSRIYLGVHFPSDIVGGYIAGFIWVIFCILVFNLIEAFRTDPKT